MSTETRAIGTASGTTAPPTRPKKPWYRTLAFREALWGYILTIPTFLVFFVGLLGIPILFTFYLTFFDWDGLSPLNELESVGFEHYGRVVRGLVNTVPGEPFDFEDADDRAGQSFWHAAQFTLGSIIGQLGLGLIMALIVHRARRGVSFMRLMFFLPVVLPGVAVNLLFRAVLYPQKFGLLNQMFEYFNVPLFIQNLLGGPAWLLAPNTAMRSLVTQGIWRWAGNYFILYLAGLQGIPDEYYDAAKVDGASALQSFWRITLPLLRPAIILTVVMNFIFSMQVFNDIVILTSGGPARATETIAYLLYQTSFGYFKYSYGATMAIVLFGTILILTVALLRSFRGSEEIY